MPNYCTNDAGWRHAGNQTRNPEVPDTLSTNADDRQEAWQWKKNVYQWDQDAKMREDDETTIVQLLNSRGHRISMSTVLLWWSSLGWTFRGSAYCQLIRSANKSKWLQWTQQYLCGAEAGFQDVIWTDEASVQMESHHRFCCRKRGEPPRNKPHGCVYIHNVYTCTCDVCVVMYPWKPFESK